MDPADKRISFKFGQDFFCNIFFQIVIYRFFAFCCLFRVLIFQPHMIPIFYTYFRNSGSHESCPDYTDVSHLPDQLFARIFLCLVHGKEKLYKSPGFRGGCYFAE